MVREDEEVDAGRPSSGAEDGDPLWVSAEVANVLIEPTQGLNLVQQAVVPLSGLITGTEEAWVFAEIKMDIEEEGMWRREENEERRERQDDVSISTFSI